MPITAASGAEFRCLYDQVAAAWVAANESGIADEERAWRVDACDVLAARLFAVPALTARGLETKVRVLALLVADAPIDQGSEIGTGPLWHALMADADAIDGEPVA
jgi:sirohydrochlorin ferrochelatase